MPSQNQPNCHIGGETQSEHSRYCIAQNLLRFWHEEYLTFEFRGATRLYRGASLVLMG